MEARPEDSVIRVWEHRADDQPGLVLVGQLDPADIVESDVENLRFTLKIQHPIARWLITGDKPRSATITVDIDGGRIRHSGLLQRWIVHRDLSGEKLLKTEWEDHFQFRKYFLDPTKAEDWLTERVEEIADAINKEEAEPSTQ